MNRTILILSFSILFQLSFGQQNESVGIKRMKISTELCIEWMILNLDFSALQVQTLKSIVVIPDETWSKLSAVRQDSLLILQQKEADEIRAKLFDVFTEEQMEQFNNRKDEFSKWLQIKMQENGC